MIIATGGAFVALVAPRIFAANHELPYAIVATAIVGVAVVTADAFARMARRAYRFYEINPLVVHFARSAFSYLQDAEGTVEIELGDARLSREHTSPERFDVLIVDAFTSDAIPIHLLMREAFCEYFRHRAPGGVVAFHVSNLHLDLAPIVKLGAGDATRVVRIVSPADASRAVSTAVWVLVAREPAPAVFAELGDATNEIDLDTRIRPWTGDYSSLWPVLRLRPPRA